MRRFLNRLREQQRRRSVKSVRPPRNAEEPQVAPPERVDLPHPANSDNEIKVPASINGEDMSKGRL